MSTDFQQHKPYSKNWSGFLACPKAFCLFAEWLIPHWYGQSWVTVQRQNIDNKWIAQARRNVDRLYKDERNITLRIVETFTKRR